MSHIIVYKTLMSTNLNFFFYGVGSSFVRNRICQKQYTDIQINTLDIVWEIASSSDVKNVWNRISTPLILLHGVEEEVGYY